MARSERCNRLSQESSPYLLQHAHNPVDWYPWGREAHELAHGGNRPILLSVGYSACHWCHVMEKESFEDENIAAIMNKHFINIKVDREERPDVDEIYMSAVQAISGSGGWPMTVFLTPDLRPFFGGTYFPPEDRYGRPGFPRVLETVARYFADDPRGVEENALRVTTALHRAETLDKAREGCGQQAIDAAVSQLSAAYDDVHGGFGEAPKFPNSMSLSLLLRHHRRSGNRGVLEMVVHSLRRMAQGGLYDHLGGGFHRYSVDAGWLVPHFEKMLYDNALLATTYLEAYQATGDDLFEQVVRETIDYVLREMAQPGGGFSAAQDADSGGEEGLYFLWRPEEVVEVLGLEKGGWLNRYFGVTEGGNFERGRSILHVAVEPGRLAESLGIELSLLESTIASGRLQLLSARQLRVAPDRDDKVIVSWNGLMLSALVKAGQVFAVDEYVAAAEETAEFILRELVIDDTLMHVFCDGIARFPAFLDDYAALAAGCLDLYEITHRPTWLEWSRELTRRMVELFWDPQEGGFFFASSAGDLILRTKNKGDGATPSGNSLAANVLLRLASIGEDEDLKRLAELTLTAFSGLMERAPTGCCMMLCALDYVLDSPFEIAVIGNHLQRREIFTTAARRFVPNKVVVGGDPHCRRPDEIAPAMLRGRLDPDGPLPRAYVCRNSVCSQPVTTADSLARLLD